jgi:hypothetical protein
MSKLKINTCLVGKTTTYTQDPYRNGRSIILASWHIHARTAKKKFVFNHPYPDAKSAMGKANLIREAGTINTTHWIAI